MQSKISTEDTAIQMIDLKDYGFQGLETDVPNGFVMARITEIQRELYRAVCPYGEVAANLKGSFFYQTAQRDDYPAVGDFVLLKYNETGTSGIEKVLPRKSKFSRTDFSGHAAGYVKTVLEQVVAANFDDVFILSSLNRDFSVNRIARYLTQARQSGAVAVIVLTKTDLCENWDAQQNAVREIAGDTDIIAVSSRTGYGLEQLNRYMQPGKTAVFLGMSGVGKSSLLNALAGEEVMTVKEIREDDARGRHTTTYRQLVRLSSGAMIIDTPGMRELGLWNADEGISASFSEIEQLIAQCRFSDCRHKSEPGCAIQAALSDGTLKQTEWDRYLVQKREASFVQRRTKFNDNRKRK